MLWFLKVHDINFACKINAKSVPICISDIPNTIKECGICFSK